METYQLTPENRQKERDTIRKIMTKNYDASTLDKLNNKKKRQRQDDQK